MTSRRRTTRPARLPRGRWLRRWSSLPAVAALAVVATGCQTEIDGADEGTTPVTLVVSETWVQSHQGSGGGAAPGEVQARISALRKGVDRLRQETRTGWVGRQDDVTGYLADLSGGSWPGRPSAFMDDHGPTLFGVDSTALRFEEPDSVTVPNTTTTRATQTVGEVPVLDASLVFSGRSPGGDGRLTGIRGRVFPGLTVSTTPTLTPEQATDTAVAAAGVPAAADGDPRLVVLPNGAGVLAWEVVVLDTGTDAPAAVGLYYVDATTGALVDLRPASAEALPRPTDVAAYAGPVEPEPNSVEVTGQDALGRDRTGFGLQTGQGVELTDTTTDAWDSAGRTGAVQTYDAKGRQTVPGDLVTSQSTTIRDADAIAAQSFSNTIVDYYESLGRDSWDNEGGDLISTVHFGGSSYCNASFASGLRQPQMVYGDPCVLQGRQLTGSFVEPDVAAHEITHGVTATSAGLLYTGQSGALNESFSDYFGNVIGDLIHGSDSATLGEDICTGISGSELCPTNPDGSVSFRYMLNGADFDDYLRILTPGERLVSLVNYKQDYGGVHYNSAIWNNALWSIRTRLAQIDGQEARTSPLAQAFDRAVYGALATRLTPTSSFVDARSGVEQVIVDSRLDPVVLRTARQVFDQLKICPGCPTPSELAGDGVTTASQTQLHPTVSGDRVVWLDLSGASEYLGYAAATTLGSGNPPSLSATSTALEVTFAGDAVMALDVFGSVTRTDGTGTTELDSVDPNAALSAGFAGSDAGAAWLADASTVKYVDSAGTVYEAEVPGLQGDTITTIAPGGGTVALGTDQGRVFSWSPGSGAPRQVGQLPGAILSAATYGGPVFAIDDSHRSVFIDAQGQAFDVTRNAAPFGATMSGRYVVWSEATASIQTDVVPGGTSPYPDTDLYLLSLASGKVYDLHPAPAQQGFPSLSGDRLVWQDATYGGDDVFTAVVPDDL